MKKSKIIWIHVDFWILIILSQFVVSYFVSQNLKTLTIAQLSLWLLNPLSNLVFVYVAYFSTWFYLKRDKQTAILIFIFPLIALFIAAYFVGNNKIASGVYCVVRSLVYAFFGILFYLGIDWYNTKQRQKELEKQNLQSELALLKNQINPHFLFNTLNNIDSLIKTNPNHASQSLIELSDMMRYMLYETKPERVPLQKELEYIENYMKLQKLQYGNTQLVEYSVSGNPDEIQVAPMLFIPFIENAFKHCTDKEKIHAIRFSFEIGTTLIYFQSSNISDDKHLISKDSSNGVGLETVKRRLEILYPNRYSLQIDKKNDLFCVSLMIYLDD
ncbi:histidine kinase [Bacteroidia bacterium]|nr:histidine kinase [Bacteroidia bacterium]GHT46055.1 histidine kinase [Bacteroidia bacterium]